MCNTHCWSLYTYGPCRFRDRGEGRARCQALSGELPTILRTEAALCGRKRQRFSHWTQELELETLEQPLPPIALYVSIRPVRGIARIIRESYLQWLRSLTRFLAYLSIFHMPTNLRVPSAKTHFPRSIHSEIVKNSGKVELNPGKWQTVFMKLNFNQSKLISKSMTYFEKKVLNFNKYLNNTNLIFTYNK